MHYHKQLRHLHKNLSSSYHIFATPDPILILIIVLYDYYATSTITMYKIASRTRHILPQVKFLRFLSAGAPPKPDGPLFPHKDEFPSRHIGPRESDVIAMLDSLGFKVSLN